MVTLVLHSDGELYVYSSGDVGKELAEEVIAFEELCKLRKIKAGDEVLRLIARRHAEMLEE